MKLTQRLDELALIKGLGYALPGPVPGSIERARPMVEEIERDPALTSEVEAFLDEPGQLQLIRYGAGRLLIVTFPGTGNIEVESSKDNVVHEVPTWQDALDFVRR